MSDSRFRPDLDLEEFPADETFAALSDETRLEVVRTLWTVEAVAQYDDVDETEATVSYSELLDLVDVDDKGRFNYHLSKLRPQFVRKTGSGYRLSGAGKKLARTVIAVSGSAPDLSEDLDVDCPLCGGPVEASYRDSWLRFTCGDCDGLFGDAAPEGTLLNEQVPRGGLTDRDVASAYRTKLYRCVLDMVYLMEGICRECAGRVRGSVDLCESHDPREDRERPCPDCGRHAEAWAELRCETCRFAKRLPVEFCVLGLSSMIGFCYRRGLDPLTPSLDGMVELVETSVQTSTTTEPLRVTVTVELDGDRLVVTLDDDLTPVETAVE